MAEKRKPKIVLAILVSPELQEVADALNDKGHDVTVMEDLSKYDLVVGTQCAYYPPTADTSFVDGLLRGAAAKRKTP